MSACQACRGDDLARHCRARLPALPIILTTGYDERRYASSVAADPLLAVLGKPFDMPRLLIRLEQLGVYATWLSQFRRCVRYRTDLRNDRWQKCTSGRLLPQSPTCTTSRIRRTVSRRKSPPASASCRTSSVRPQAAPELIQQLWGFAKAGYLDNPMPSVFKERLFVWLSRFCPTRYCIVRHVGFLLAEGHARRGRRRAAPDRRGGPAAAPPAFSLATGHGAVYARLERLAGPLDTWPDSGSEIEDAIFACAAVMFVEPARSERARHAVIRAVGARRFEFFSGCLAFIRTAHYWTMLHPEIETEDDMRRCFSGRRSSPACCSPIPRPIAATWASACSRS